MKKFFFTIFVFIVFTSYAHAKAPPIGKQALDSLKRTGGHAGLSKDPAVIPNFIQILGTYVNGLLTLMGVLFMVLIIYGGFIWMTAAGEEGKIERAKKIVTGSIIGLSIILMARVITFFLLGAFEGAF